MLSVCRTHRAGSSPNYFHPRDRASSSQRCQWIYLSLSLVRTPSFSPSPPCLAVRASPPLHAALPTAMTLPHPALFSWHFPHPFSTALSFLLLLPLSSPLLPLPCTVSVLPRCAALLFFFLVYFHAAARTRKRREKNCRARGHTGLSYQTRRWRDAVVRAQLESACERGSSGADNRKNAAREGAADRTGVRAGCNGMCPGDR